MAHIVVPFLKFRPSTSPDAVAHLARPEANYDLPGVVLRPTIGTDGYARVPVNEIPFLEGVEGDVEVYVTAMDNAGNESDFLRVAGPLDLSPPAAPTDGSIESGA